jgi:hypothetical protein
MALDLTKMDVVYKGQPFVELSVGGLNLLGMDVVYQGQPFVRGSEITENPFHKLIFNGSSYGPKLKLLGHGTTRKLKVI